ncbi:hypothetical protein M501DRAFT_1010040 [Patellaria atrata CBS 101060]|uniref:Only prolin and serin are matching in the corresponding protein n=1 Tax=Patellaria atrata CBS 101060 TaxID=1346257 RepID=A0A9P4SDU1_9PEZI|nr:hypothetical protein M501DRAFT_1010040 [Patellaria atrata CBS 101060]
MPLRPLQLPRLVAAKYSSNTPVDDLVSSQLTTLTHSSDSSPSVASECSTPLTPTFSTRSHMRYPSSTSSLSSSPPIYDHVEHNGSTNKLPGVMEDPMEVDDEFVVLEHRDRDFEYTPCLCDEERCAHDTSPIGQSTAAFSSSPHYDLSDDWYYNDSDFTNPHMAKRRRSGDSPLSGIAARFGNRFPTLSRRRSDRKSAVPGQISRSATPSRTASLRSLSLTSPVFPPVEEQQCQSIPSPSHESHDLADETTPTQEDIVETVIECDPIDRQALASTPLLPPLMVDLRSSQDSPIQSPLQSPTIAEAPSSIVNTPTGTPGIPSTITPPLSSPPSIASLHRSGYMVSSAEYPPMMIADPDDKWADKLGHANFTIFPEPYSVEIYDSSTCRQLFADWEQARRNFTKHQVRTGEHFGTNSKIYKLTDEKWAEIDARWKRSYDQCCAEAARSGQDALMATPSEPAPLSKMPTLNDPRSEGKFPTLGDEDIVGPMVQFAAQIQRRPSKKSAFLRFLGDMKLSGSLFRRPSTGVGTSV